MRKRIAAVFLLALLSGWRCFTPDEDQDASASETFAPASAGAELPALLAAAGSSTTELAGNAQFKRGIEQLRGGAAAAAQRTFDETAKQSRGLADWSTYFAAWAAATAGDTVAAAVRVQKLDEDFRDIYAWRALSYAHEKAGSMPRAISIANDAAQKTKGPRRFEASVEAARLLVAQGDSARGRTLVLAAIDSASTPTRVKAATLLEKLSPKPSEWLSIARAQRAAGRASDALASYDKAGTPLARLERGQLLFAQRRYANTVVQLSGIARGNTALAADAQLLLSRAELRLGNAKIARAGLQRALDIKAASPLTRAGAAYMLGDLAQDADEDASARKYFRTAIDAMPTSEPAAQSFMRLGLDALLRGENTQAVAIFDEFRQAHAQTNYGQQAMYWSARAHERARQKPKARELMTDVIARDQFSYYGLIAGEWLGLPATVLNKGPTTTDEVQQQARGALRRTQLLQSLQLSEAASFEQERTRAYLADQNGGLHFLAEELQRQGRIADGITIGRRLHDADGRWNARTLKLIYPLPYRETIEKHARANGVNPYLLAALIRQESMFNPNAKSAAGALGLMQVMPKTGRSVAGRLGMKGFTPKELTDPEINVRIGAAHFRNLLIDHENQLEHVIAAYNAGATPVARWRRLDHQNDPQLFSERIPYAETREYVKILVRNTNMYELLYGAPARRSVSL